MREEYRCPPRHPFTVGDHVKAKYHPEYGIGTVTEMIGDTNLWTEWENLTDRKNFHCGHLELTQDRPLTAKEKVLEALRTEQERLRAERAKYLRDVDEKIRKLGVALNAVDAVEL